MPAGTGFQPVPDHLIITRRDLPHWQLGNSTYFLTFRLRRGLPPLDPAECRLTLDAILFWHSVRWRMHCATVMPDHVHVLASPLATDSGWVSLSTILHSVKGYSARRINQRRERRGHLWQSETFDRIVRSEAEYQQMARYVLENAVRSGLVEQGEDYDGFWTDSPG